MQGYFFNNKIFEMKIQILITSYNRPELLLDLLKDIQLKADDHELDILIMDDHSDLDYSKPVDYLLKHFKDQFYIYRNETNFGKKDYWLTIDKAFKFIGFDSYDYLIQLPDDVLLVPDFFNKAIEAFEAIDDPYKSCLNILNDYSRNGKSFWTKQTIKDVSFGDHKFVYTGWVDMCFIASPHFLNLLDHEMHEVKHSWSGKENLSSGVGMQISQRLVNDLKTNIYQVNKSLVIHEDHPSVMHPFHRQENPLMSNHYTDKITATIATMKGRELSLQETILSIIDQVDEIHIYLNDIDVVPSYCVHQKIKCFLSNDYCGDLGDAGKFFTADQITGYHFTIDDDIVYPSNYVSFLIQKIEEYSRTLVVSCHGRLFDNLPVASYYNDHTKAFSCLRQVDEDEFAHVVGTGVLAYHTDTLNLDLSIFEFSNMADIWFSKYCNENKIPRLIVEHAAGWIKLSKFFDASGSIFNTQSLNDEFQTEITNSVTWKEL